MLLVFSAHKVAKILSGVVASLVMASVLAQVGQSMIPADTHRGLSEALNKFVLDSELNIPTWYSSGALLVSAVLLAIIASAKRRDGSPYFMHWAAMTAIFVLMSIDELAGIHEMLIVPIRRRLGGDGFFYYGWVLPGLVFVVGVGLSYLRFLFCHLEATHRWRFIAAGTIFVAGALGMEMAEGPLDRLYGDESVIAKAAATTEESLEMVGIVVFIYSLMSYIELHVGTIQLRIIEGSSSGIIRGASGRRDSYMNKGEGNSGCEIGSEFVEDYAESAGVL